MLEGDRLRRARRNGKPVDPQEWMSLEYVDWKSGSDTRFARWPAYGEIECNGFWHFDPLLPTRTDGVWIDSQVGRPRPWSKRAKENGANVGRCRIIELQPNTYAGRAVQLPLGRQQPPLNPDGEGWVVRRFMNLTDDQDTYDPVRTSTTPAPRCGSNCPAGAQAGRGLRAPLALRCGTVATSPVTA